MKKLIVVSLLWSFFIQLVFPQERENISNGNFIKRIEYNIDAGGYNFNGKNDVTKLFFGDFNAPIEFIYEPSFEGASGFRIKKDSLNKSYILEVKYISNYKEATKEAEAKVKEEHNFHSIETPVEMLGSIRGFKIDSSYLKMYFEELPKCFKIKVVSYPVSKQFAEKLYEKMTLFIENFKAKGVPCLTLDGYSVTFRTVVEDEVWSLRIHMPQGEALKMANICKQIIEDAEANQLNESKYLNLLE
jgi:hypothetical protein